MAKSRRRRRKEEQYLRVESAEAKDCVLAPPLPSHLDQKFGGGGRERHGGAEPRPECSQRATLGLHMCDNTCGEKRLQVRCRNGRHVGNPRRCTRRSPGFCGTAFDLRFEGVLMRQAYYAEKSGDWAFFLGKIPGKVASSAYEQV